MSLTTDSAARKRIPIFTGLLVYFPDALAGVAAHSFDSNEKHNPGEPCHWSREKSNDHLDCIARHLTDIAAKPNDLDLKVAELKAIAWRALAELQLAIELQQAVVKHHEAAQIDEVIYSAEKEEALTQFAPLSFERAPYTSGSFDVVSTLAHNIGETGGCDCASCITRSLEPR